MARIVHFELPADDPARAAKFYEEAFGWSFQKWDGAMDYWLVTTGDDSEPGINGGMYPREKPGQGLCNVVSVTDLDAAVDRVRAAGGAVNMARAAIPTVGYYASVRDTEGNVVGLMQFDPSAT